MSKIISTKEKHREKWLAINEIKYSGPDGKPRIWESVSRTTKASNHIADAVCIIPILRRALHHNCFVTIKQFRPPLGAYTMEFPAGLIDAEDKSIETSALRELYEETGYTGKVTQVMNQPAGLDPGILGTTMVSVIVEIDGDDPKNKNPIQHLDEGEFVEVVILPMHDFDKHLHSKIATYGDEKILVDSRVQAFATGMQLGQELVLRRSNNNKDDSPFGESDKG